MGKPRFKARTCAPPPEREAGQHSGAWMWILHGNVTERGDVGRGPRKSSLFFLTTLHPEIGLSGARVPRWEEPRALARSGAPRTAPENPREGIVLTPGRTHNRSRSPR